MNVTKRLAAGGIAFVLGAGAAAAQTEVVVWVAGEPGETTIYETLAATYNAAHPGTVITVVKNSSDLFNPALVPALSAGEGPDLFSYGTGPGQPAAVIKGGLVADLTPYYDKFNWAPFIPEAIENVTTAQGKLWAVGNEVENTGMFYNKAIFAKAGIAVPTTWAEFETAIATLKNAGYETPIGLGGADKWPISHIQSMLFGRYAGPSGLEDVMFGDGSWADEVYVKAAARFQQMAVDGYFGPYPVATGQAETLDTFWAGQIPMVYTGTFVIPGGLQAAGDRIGDFGVFQMPPLEDGQKVYPTESIGSGWYIRANSDKKDQAADFLNFMFFTPEGRTALLESGTVPIGPLDDLLTTAKIPALSQEMAASVDAARANGSIPAYLDTMMPANVTTVTYDGLQALLLSSITPEKFVESIEAEWQAAKAAGDILQPGGIER